MQDIARNDDLIVKTVSADFATAKAVLLQILQERGVRVFCQVDHTEAAVEAGLTLRPTVVVIFGNPRAGTPVMEAAPTFALDLPLRVLVWEENGTTSFATHSAESLAAPHGYTGDRAVLNAAAGVISVVVERLTKDRQDH